MESISWKDVAHYGSAVTCLALAGMTELGVSLPGVTVDPKIAGAAGIGILAAGLKGGVTSGKAVIAFLILSSAALLVQPVYAADMPQPKTVYKAPPVGYPYDTSGIYYGVGASANTQATSVANTGAFDASAGLRGVVGYQWKGGLDFLAFEVAGVYENLGSAGLCGGVPCSTNTKWQIEPRFKAGFPFSVVQSVLPNWAALFPGLTFPSNITVTGTQHPYVFLGVPIQQNAASFNGATGTATTAQLEAGIGLQNQWQQNSVVDISTGFTLNGVGVTIAGPKVPGADFGLGWKTQLDVLF